MAEDYIFSWGGGGGGGIGDLWVFSVTQVVIPL
jgi:hypothetical protein